MSTYYFSIIDNGAGQFAPLVQRGGTAPSGGTVLTIPENDNNATYGGSTATITGATNATPIVITANNTFSNGDFVTVMGVGGNTGANGTFQINTVSSTGFTLANSVGNAAYTSGGSALKLSLTPAMYVSIEAAKRAALNDRASGN